MDNEPRPRHLIDHREPRQVSTPVLVVEDDPQLRIIFQLLLEGEGYPVVAAADGLEALRAAYGPRLPIVVVTATGQHAAMLDGINPAAYVHKPFDVDGLLAWVWRCLESPAESRDRTWPAGLP